MKYHRLPSNASTFSQLREFLSTSHTGAQFPRNAFDQSRLEFTYSVSCAMHNTSPRKWENQTAVWVDSHKTIRAALVTEGENQGEAFILTENNDLSPDLIQDILDFAEKAASVIDEGGNRKLLLRFPDHLSQAESLVKQRGYKQAPWEDKLSEYSLDSRNPHFASALSESPEPPENYRLLTGFDATPQLKGMCHAAAFGYRGTRIYEERIIQGFTNLQSMPGYLPDLDLMLLDKSGLPAAMMGFWHDEPNQWGALEPAGTVPPHTRKGLGRWLIQEGVRRLNALGTKKIFCGTDKLFYLNCGFRLVDSSPIWEKTW